MHLSTLNKGLEKVIFGAFKSTKEKHGLPGGEDKGGGVNGIIVKREIKKKRC